MTLRLTSVVLLISVVIVSSGRVLADIDLSGELMTWHKVTLTMDGPETSERATPNPFMDYRLDVTFTGSNGQAYVVPGFFAADGNAAITSATSGNKWRVHFAPDSVGDWSYKVSFKSGPGIAIADKPVGTSVASA